MMAVSEKLFIELLREAVAGGERSTVCGEVGVIRTI